MNRPFVIVTLSPLTLVITFPANNANLPMDETMVRGTVTSVFTRFMVDVNGIMAEIQGDQFVAAKISLTKGLNTITAKAVDSEGHTKTVQITVNSATANHSPLELATDVTSGAAPLAITFYLKYSYPEAPGTMVSAAIDWEGDGINDATPTTLSISHTYTQEGIYFPKLTMTDDLGNTYMAVTYINVYPMPPLEVMWNDMKAKLAAGDIEGALEFYHTAYHNKYRTIYTALGEQLPALVAQMGSLELISVRADSARYRIIRTQVIEGVSRQVEYEIEFTRDLYGRWRIEHL